MQIIIKNLVIIITIIAASKKYKYCDMKGNRNTKILHNSFNYEVKYYYFWIQGSSVIKVLKASGCHSFAN
jgi:hypothetical protein